jgi:hypothetical protein
MSESSPLVEISPRRDQQAHRFERFSQTSKRSYCRYIERSPLSAPAEKKVIACDEKSERSGAKKVILDPENVEKGLAQLVLTVLELLRQVMERQAVHRMDSGDLNDGQIERLGQTLMKLEEKVIELREHFGLEPDDLNINLGPLGNLM